MASNVKQVIKPLLVVSKIFGVICIKSSNNHHEQSRLGALLITIAITLFTLAVVYYNVDLVYRREIILLRIIYFLLMLVSWIEVLVVWGSAIAHQKLYIDFLRRLSQLEVEIKNIATNNFKTARTRSILHLLAATVVTIIDMLVGNVVDLDYILYKSYNHLPVIITGVIIENFAVYTYAIKTYYGVINSSCELLQESGDDEEKTNGLRVLRLLHINLTHVSKMLNRIFAYGLLIIVTVNFIALMVAFYLACIMCKHFETTMFTMEQLNLFMYILPILCYTIYLCYCCHTTVEMCTKTGQHIHAIDFDSERVQDEIEMFSMQIINEDLRFTAAGFFIVDYSLLFSIIGWLTTYIIILIQFSPSLEKSLHQS